MHFLFFKDIQYEILTKSTGDTDIEKYSYDTNGKKIIITGFFSVILL